MCGGSPLIDLGFDVDSGIDVLVVGEITQERRCKIILSFSPLSFCMVFQIVSGVFHCRGEYTGEENVN